MRSFITLSYDGTAYHGWQVQPHSNSVQEELQKALSTLLRENIEIVGAGRTDTGVHARKMIAHFDFGPLDGKQLVYKLNKILPRDIAVQSVDEVAEDMHARFSAKSRTYHYFLHLSKNPFLRAYSWQMYGDLDFEKMNEAAKVLMEYRDFTSFSKTNTDTKTNDCTITEAHWKNVGGNQWRFTISANRFLRNMVRAVVGTLFEVGKGRMSEEEFSDVIAAHDRCRAGHSVPAEGLSLVEIKYPEIIYTI
jgi:tRNA pseudouridine38-40 synthase